MLRALVLSLALLNLGLFLWLRSDPQSLQGEREPQRVGRQIQPDAIQVLPDLPNIASPAAIPGAGPASAASAAAAGSSPIDATLARRTGTSDLACVETGALTLAQWAALTQALAKAGIAADAIAERREQQPGRWIVYMGRYPDPQLWQHKADELRRLGVKFERVSAPPGLDPGLSLGDFTSADDAGAHLDELTRRGVHTARVVEMAPPGVGVRRHLQVRANDERWRSAVPDRRFSACPAAPSATL